MRDPTPTDDAPPSADPFYSSWEPRDGPILGHDCPGSLGIMGQPGATMPIGTACPVGLVDHRRGPAQTFRMVVG